MTKRANKQNKAKTKIEPQPEKQIQILEGNTGSLTVRLLSEILIELKRIKNG